VSWVLELNMAEAACSAILTHCDTYLSNGSESTEEVPDGLFLCVETNIAAENCVGNTSFT
jgi:hypothetical protein